VLSAYFWITLGPGFRSSTAGARCSCERPSRPDGVLLGAWRPSSRGGLASNRVIPSAALALAGPRSLASQPRTSGASSRGRHRTWASGRSISVFIGFRGFVQVRIQFNPANDCDRLLSYRVSGDYCAPISAMRTTVFLMSSSSFAVFRGTLAPASAFSAAARALSAIFRRAIVLDAAPPVRGSRVGRGARARRPSAQRHPPFGLANEPGSERHVLWRSSPNHAESGRGNHFQAKSNRLLLPDWLLHGRHDHPVCSQARPAGLSAEAGPGTRPPWFHPQSRGRIKGPLNH